MRATRISPNSQKVAITAGICVRNICKLYISRYIFTQYFSQLEKMSVIKIHLHDLMYLQHYCVTVTYSFCHRCTLWFPFWTQRTHISAYRWNWTRVRAWACVTPSSVERCVRLAICEISKHSLCTLIFTYQHLCRFRVADAQSQYHFLTVN